MNYLLGVFFIWSAFTYLQDAMDPNRMSRTRVRIMASSMCAVSLGLALILIFAPGAG